MFFWILVSWLAESKALIFASFLVANAVVPLIHFIAVYRVAQCIYSSLCVHLAVAGYLKYFLVHNFQQQFQSPESYVNERFHTPFGAKCDDHWGIVLYMHCVVLGSLLA